MMKVFVGTLESGESEFLECQKALSSQIDVAYFHHVISGKHEREAHKELFEYWATRRHEFDYFLKLDADTVLMRQDAVAQMCNLMKTHDATGLQVRILDFFSGQLISGLNMFSQDVMFRKRLSRLHPDVSDSQHRLVLKGNKVQHLEPVAFHGLHPNRRQSFYYGFHRYLKGQKSLLVSVYERWKLELDIARKWALIGAIEGHKWKFSKHLYSSSFVNYRYSQTTNRNISSHAIDNFFEVHLAERSAE
jgi:hypothetical protein